ncbi:MAG: helix-turn-helix domain-containing protein [Intestinibacter bartlettii]|uniref:helix-turn-helix domain-containing protein n=1 Tax=Intestinibacter bartlettii TaxID=261299 RepID=UPI003996093B
MEVGKQIKNFRQDLKLSQEELASKIFVTRQTISNLENGKNYPDVNSLIMLSQLFTTSLDILVKGDVIEMKKQVSQDDVRRFKLDTIIFTVLIILTVISVVPLVPLFRIVRDCIMAFNCKSYDILCNATEQTKKEQ